MNGEVETNDALKDQWGGRDIHIETILWRQMTYRNTNGKMETNDGSKY